VVEIHRHAVDDFKQQRGRDGVALRCVVERARGGVLRLACREAADLGPPPVELGLGHLALVAFVDHVVELAAQRVKRRDRAPRVRRQEDKAVVEAGAAGGGAILAILMDVHVQ